MSSVQITGIKLKRSQNFSLDICHLNIPAKAVTCIAGPNGSGKTTLIECLVGLVKPDEGEMTFSGHKPDNLMKLRASVGYLPDDEDWLIGELSATEYFELIAKTYRQAGVTASLETRAVKLARRLYFSAYSQPLSSLSHGNKKKVQLIACLMHKPQLIIIDELRNGLDPLAIMAAEEIIIEEAARGATVLAATHDLWWAERTATHIILLADGQVALDASAQTVKQEYGSLEKAFLKMARP